MIATALAKLAAVRAKKQRPAEMLLLTFLPINAANPTIAIKPVERVADLDLRCLTGLEITLVTSQKTKPELVDEWSHRILAERPEFFAVVVHENGAGMTLVEDGLRKTREWSEAECEEWRENYR